MTRKCGPWIWSLSFALFSQSVLGLNLHYVSPAVRAQIQKDFEAAHSPLPAQIEGKWNCDLIGAKTGLQREENLPLYEFSKENASSFQNHGAAPHSHYKLAPDHRTLIGTDQKIEETLRFQSANTLMVKMARADNKEAVAFARCRKFSSPLTARGESIETVATDD
jgi:hypothetical protein